MTLNAFVIHFMQYMNTRKGDISIGEISNQMLGYKDLTSAEVIEYLKNKHYVSMDGNKLQISEVGKTYIESLQQRELESIHNFVFDDHDLALIAFLYDRNDYVKLEDFPDVLMSKAPQHGNAVNNGNLLHALFKLKPYINEKYHWYMINDTGKAFYERRNPTQGPKQQKNGASNPASVQDNFNLEIPVLTDAERLWLSELYNLTVKGERFTHRHLWAKLHEKIPSTFKTAAVDERLISSDGATIRILGVAALQGNHHIIEQTNLVINSIRKMILANGEIRNILIDEIARATTLPNLEISLCLELARYYVNLYNGSTFDDNSTILKSIDVAGSNEIFYNYLHFQGIEYYLVKPNRASGNNNGTYFTPSDWKMLNTKANSQNIETKKIMKEVFVTYSWDSEEHNDKVMAFTNELRDIFNQKT